MPFDNLPGTPFSDIQLLWDARNRISDRDHWVQGRFEDGDRHCLVAALSLVSGSPCFDIGSRVERRLSRHLVRHLPPTSAVWGIKFFTARWRLICFNDDADTSYEDVIELIDRTINHLASQEPALCSIAQRSPVNGVHF